MEHGDYELRSAWDRINRHKVIATRCLVRAAESTTNLLREHYMDDHKHQWREIARIAKENGIAMADVTLYAGPLTTTQTIQAAKPQGG